MESTISKPMSEELKQKAESGKVKIIDLDDVSFRGKTWGNTFKIKGKIYGKSYGNNVNFTSFDGLTLIKGYYRAYEEHCPIVISPDIIWLLITQAFASHINFNAEKLRSLFVDFEGQMTLKVIINKKKIGQLTTEDYNSSFNSFSNQIESFIGKENKEIFDFNFSTTTPLIKTVGYATLMCGMQKYFKYEMLLKGCGIPYIVLEGTVEDWLKIRENLEKIEKFGLENWCTEVSIIIDQIIAEYKNEQPNKEFWRNFIRKDQAKEYGRSGMTTFNVDAIQGWLLSFYPYNSKGKLRHDLKGPVKVKELSETFSCDIVITPLTIIEQTTGKTYNLELRSGFLGMTKDNYHLVKPKFGWIVSEKCEDFKNKQDK